MTNRSNTDLSDEIAAAMPEMVHAGTTEVFVVIGLLASLCVIGTVGNALVLYVYSKKKDKMVSTLFILILAIVDFTTCTVIMPFTIYMEYVDFNVGFDIVCKVYQFFITSNIPFSALIMVAIAIDRYLCICHPFLHALNLHRAKVMTSCLAISAASLGIIVSMMYGVYQLAAVSSSSISSTSSMLSADNVTVASPSSIHGIPSSTAAPSLATTTTTTEMANTTSLPNGRRILYTSQCAPNELIVSKTFTWYYQKFYTGMYLVCLIIVIVLYTLIYNSVLSRRAKRAKQKSKALPIVTRPETADTGTTCEETLLTAVDVENEETCANGNSTKIELSSGVGRKKPNKKDSRRMKEERKKEKERKKSKKCDKTRMANLKTAAMLFVVTVVFILTFLPAFLMALQMIPYNMIVFYMYFANNCANPVIYSFMNRNFRDDLKKIFCSTR